MEDSLVLRDFFSETPYSLRSNLMTRVEVKGVPVDVQSCRFQTYQVPYYTVPQKFGTVKFEIIRYLEIFIYIPF